MAQHKTRPATDSVTTLLHSVKDDIKRNDSFTLLNLMKEITGEASVLRGNNLTGFGKNRYKYERGRSCLYIKKPGDVDINVLKELINLSAKHTKTFYSN